MAISFSSSPWLLCFLAFLLSHGVFKLEASHNIYTNLHVSEPLVSSQQPYRTAYHFQPPKNWINDPNGPMIYKGLYHLFYQYNPKGAVWGNIVWAHSTSTDLVNWTPHEPAIYPSISSDINGCWSGSATILPDGKPAIFYTGINPQNQQVQNLAVPKDLSDPFLREWVKFRKNPLMAPTQANGLNASSFRDPTTAWLGPDKRWRLVIGSKRDRRGLAILYRSKDFHNWVKAKHPLHSANGTGMWECPDFFPVAVNSPYGVHTSVFGDEVKHVLKVSLDDTKHEYYTIGTYDIKKDKYIPDKGSVENDAGLRYDYGKFYASKTFFDSVKKRRILWGWINESSSVSDDVKKGWAGLQAIPRTLLLDKSGKQLIQWPVPEIEKLRQNKVNFANKPLNKGSVLKVPSVTATQADVEVSFKIKGLEKADEYNPIWADPQVVCTHLGASENGSVGPFGLLVLASNGLKEYTAVFFRIFKYQAKYVVLFCSDQSRSSLNQDNDKSNYGTFLDVDLVNNETLSLRSLIDHSIVESFGGKGKGSITARVYPTLAIGDGASLYAFNNGTQSVEIESLNAWSMKKAKIN